MLLPPPCNMLSLRLKRPVTNATQVPHHLEWSERYNLPNTEQFAKHDGCGKLRQIRELKAFQLLRLWLEGKRSVANNVRSANTHSHKRHVDHDPRPSAREGAKVWVLERKTPAGPGGTHPRPTCHAVETTNGMGSGDRFSTAPSAKSTAAPERTALPRVGQHRRPLPDRSGGRRHQHSQAIRKRYFVRLGEFQGSATRKWSTRSA